VTGFGSTIAMYLHASIRTFIVQLQGIYTNNDELNKYYKVQNR
jgi:hypothetical protein